VNNIAPSPKSISNINKLFARDKDSAIRSVRASANKQASYDRPRSSSTTWRCTPTPCASAPTACAPCKAATWTRSCPRTGTRRPGGEAIYSVGVLGDVSFEADVCLRAYIRQRGRAGQHDASTSNTGKCHRDAQRRRVRLGAVLVDAEADAGDHHDQGQRAELGWQQLVAPSNDRRGRYRTGCTVDWRGARGSGGLIRSRSNIRQHRPDTPDPLSPNDLGHAERQKHERQVVEADEEARQMYKTSIQHFTRHTRASIL